ncbi:MAG TPA: Xaa-Pro peptidase family protein, partial [Acidimicrobiia bacterium]|nr:Xaa-Pro peptidase family protein [Acidimicrobiia bacterium]
MTPTVDFDHAARRAALEPILEEAGVGLLWLPIGADLEYLTGIERRVPTFGEVNYTHGWVAGAFLAPGRDPVFVLPRNYVEFDLPAGVPGEVVSVSESDDGEGIFARMAAAQPAASRVAIGARTWGSAVIRLLEAFPGAGLVDGTRLVNRLRRIKTDDELVLMREACRIVDEAMSKTAPKVDIGVTEMDLAEEVNHHLVREGARTWSFDTAVWSMGPLDDRDATVRISHNPLNKGMGVSFDFGSVYRGYCSDFGRTIHVGEPSDEYREVYDIVMAAQQAGIDTVRPGVTAAEV